MKLKDLRDLPRRAWDNEKQYESIYVIPSGRKHESGWAIMNIIGIENGKPVEIAASCDDINWFIPESSSNYSPNLRTDMVYPSGVIHFWIRGYMFEVGHSSSSTDVRLIKK